MPPYIWRNRLDVPQTTGMYCNTSQWFYHCAVCERHAIGKVEWAEETTSLEVTHPTVPCSWNSGYEIGASQCGCTSIISVAAECTVLLSPSGASRKLLHSYIAVLLRNKERAGYFLLLSSSWLWSQNYINFGITTQSTSHNYLFTDMYHRRNCLAL